VGTVRPVPLILDLLRHGEAAASSADGDTARPLTARGEAALERLARHLAATGAGWDRVFASPLLRARQTAKILHGSVAGAPEPEIMEELVADSEPEEVVMALRSQEAVSGRVLLVGHMPLLGDLAAHLCDGGAAPLLPGQLLRLEFTGAFGRAAARRVMSLSAESIE